MTRASARWWSARALRLGLDRVLDAAYRMRTGRGRAATPAAACARALVELGATATARCARIPPVHRELLAGLARAGSRPSAALVERALDRILGRPSRRLAVYGTLAPGRENAWVLAGMSGRWSRGTVRGRIDRAGTPSTEGYPAFHREPSGPRCRVRLFSSSELPARWRRIDAFEGRGYGRILVVVATGRGPVVANVYAVDGPAPSPRRGADRGSRGRCRAAAPRGLDSRRRRAARRR